MSATVSSIVSVPPSPAITARSSSGDAQATARTLEEASSTITLAPSPRGGGARDRRAARRRTRPPRRRRRAPRGTTSATPARRAARRGLQPAGGLARPGHSAAVLVVAPHDREADAGADPDERGEDEQRQGGRGELLPQPAVAAPRRARRRGSGRPAPPRSRRGRSRSGWWRGRSSVPGRDGSGRRPRPIVANVLDDKGRSRHQAEDPEPEAPAAGDVGPVVHTQVDAREADGRGDRDRHRTRSSPGSPARPCGRPRPRTRSTPSRRPRGRSDRRSSRSRTSGSAGPRAVDAGLRELHADDHEHERERRA